MPTRSTVDVLDLSDRTDGDLSPRTVVTKTIERSRTRLKERRVCGKRATGPRLYAWPFRPLMTVGRQGIKPIYAPDAEGKLADELSAGLMSLDAMLAKTEVAVLSRITLAVRMTIPLWP